MALASITRLCRHSHAYCRGAGYTHYRNNEKDTCGEGAQPANVGDSSSLVYME